MRIALVVALLIGLSGPADARRGGLVVVVTGSEILHVRDIPNHEALGLAYPKLGYKYDRWALFWIDFARTDGTWVTYDGDMYVELDHTSLEAIGGASVPWKYHLPLGWILVVALIEVVLVTRSRRRVGAIYGVAGAMGLIALVFLPLGLHPEWVIPLALAIHHIVVVQLALRQMARLEVAIDREYKAAKNAVVDDEPRRRPSEALPSPPRGVETDPFRAPPEPKLIVTEKPPERPSTTPIVHDANAEQPKLLR